MQTNKIGNKIRELRKKFKLTQAQLAEKLGTTIAVISRWENGRHIPDSENIIRLSKIFNYDFLNLYEETNMNSKIYKGKIVIDNNQIAEYLLSLLEKGIMFFVDTATKEIINTNDPDELLINKYISNVDIVIRDPVLLSLLCEVIRVKNSDYKHKKEFILDLVESFLPKVTNLPAEII